MPKKAHLDAIGHVVDQDKAEWLKNETEGERRDETRLSVQKHLHFGITMTTPATFSKHECLKGNTQTSRSVRLNGDLLSIELSLTNLFRPIS